MSDLLHYGVRVHLKAPHSEAYAGGRRGDGQTVVEYLPTTIAGDELWGRREV